MEGEIYHGEFLKRWRGKFTMESFKKDGGGNLPWKVLKKMEGEIYHGKFLKRWRGKFTMESFKKDGGGNFPRCGWLPQKYRYLHAYIGTYLEFCPTEKLSGRANSI
jgi:hypothetical protein